MITTVPLPYLVKVTTEQKSLALNGPYLGPVSSIGIGGKNYRNLNNTGNHIPQFTMTVFDKN